MRGEDYDFQFSGRVREGKLQCRLNLEYVGDDSQQDIELTDSEKQRFPDLIPIAWIAEGLNCALRLIKSMEQATVI